MSRRIDPCSLRLFPAVGLAVLPRSAASASAGTDRFARRTLAED